MAKQTLEEHIESSFFKAATQMGDRVKGLSCLSPSTIRFRADNTEGYSAAELDEFNLAFETFMCSPDYECGDEIAGKSYADYIAEAILFEFGQKTIP